MASRTPLALSLAGLAAVAAAAPPALGATIPRDGAWAGTTETTGCFDGIDGAVECDVFAQQAYMVLRSKAPRKLTYEVLLRCTSREDGKRYDTGFRGKGLPGNRAIPPRGILRVQADVPDAGLSGRVVSATITLDFARRGKPQFKVLASRTTPTETCSGRADILLDRGPTPREPRPGDLPTAPTR